MAEESDQMGHVGFQTEANRSPIPSVAVAMKHPILILTTLVTLIACIVHAISSSTETAADMSELSTGRADFRHRSRLRASRGRPRGVEEARATCNA